VPRPITEPGKGKYWTVDITGGEGYKRERKRRNKRQRSSDGDDDDDDDDVSDDEGTSSAGSPGPSGVRIQQQEPQSGVHRVRSSPRGTSPYAAASSSTPSSLAGYSGGPIPSAGSSQSYHRVDAPSSQMSFDRTGFGESQYRQPAFGQSSMGQGTRSFTERPVAHQGQRPSAVRAQTVPDAFSPSSGSFGDMASLQSISPPGLMGSLSVSPTEIQQHFQVQGYDGGASGYDIANMNMSVNTPTQYGQGHYDMRMGMGRGNNNPNHQGSHGRGRTF
jgi:hypothetical protein